MARSLCPAHWFMHTSAPHFSLCLSTPFLCSDFFSPHFPWIYGILKVPQQWNFYKIKEICIHLSTSWSISSPTWSSGRSKTFSSFSFWTLCQPLCCTLNSVSRCFEPLNDSLFFAHEPTKERCISSKRKWGTARFLMSLASSPSQDEQ